MRGKGPKTFLYCLLIDYIFVCFNKILKKYPHTLKLPCLLCSEFVQRLIQTENTAGLKLKIPLTPLRWGIIKRNKASFEFSPTLTQEPGGKESLFNFKSGNNTPQLASKPRSLATKQRTCFILMLKKEYWKCHAANCSLLNRPPIKTEYQQEAIHSERRMDKTWPCCLPSCSARWETQSNPNNNSGEGILQSTEKEVCVVTQRFFLIAEFYWKPLRVQRMRQLAHTALSKCFFS